MQLAQVTLAVPDDIYEGILAGTLEIAAGVVRDNKGVIRKHLPKVVAPAKENAAKVAKAAKVANAAKNNKVVKAAPVAKGNGIVQLVKKNPGVAIAAGAVVAVGGGVAYLAHHVKQKKMTKQEECVSDFQKALKAYLKAAKTGKLNEKVVDDLLVALENAQSSKAGDAVMLSIPAKQLNDLISSIFDYTKRLAEANAFKDVRISAPKRGTKNSIANLQSYLEIQKQIIEKAA